jgi:hypothetical protein
MLEGLGYRLHMRALRSAVGAIVSLLASACGPEAVDTETSWSHEYVTAACAQMFANECDCPGPLPWSSREVCEQQDDMFVRHAQLDAIGAGLVFDESCAYAHVDAIDALDCEAPEELESSTETCQVYYGDKEVGDACSLFFWAVSAEGGYWMSDCKQGLLCPLAGHRCTTPEQPFVVLDADAKCIDDSGSSLGRCPTPQACDRGSGACVIPAAVGDECPEAFPCADAWCDGGTCAPRKADGDQCSDSSECQSLFCNGTACGPAPHVAAACIAITR